MHFICISLFKFIKISRTVFKCKQKSSDGGKPGTITILPTEGEQNELQRSVSIPCLIWWFLLLKHTTYLAWYFFFPLYADSSLWSVWCSLSSSSFVLVKMAFPRSNLQRLQFSISRIRSSAPMPVDRRLRTAHLTWRGSGLSSPSPFPQTARPFHWMQNAGAWLITPLYFLSRPEISEEQGQSP